MQKRKLISKLSAAALAGIMGASSLLPVISASADGTLYSDGSVGLSKSYYNGSAYLNANSYGVANEYVRLAGVSDGGDYILYLASADQTNYGICLRPSVWSGRGSWITQRNTTYWNNLKTNHPEIVHAIGLAMYYGYPGAVNGKTDNAKAYYAATQMIVWEFVLGYRNTEGTMQMRSGYPKLIDFYNANAATKTAYTTISNKLSTHYNVPSTMVEKAADAKKYVKGSSVLMTYSFAKNYYTGSYTVKAADNTEEKNWNEPVSTALNDLAAKWNKNKYNGQDIGATVTPSKSGNDTKYTITADHVPFSSTTMDATAKIAADMKNNTIIPDNWVIYAVSDNRQDIAFNTVKADPVSGYIGVATPNFANLTIKKDFEYDGENVDKDKAVEYTESVSFTIRTNVSGTDYYVQAMDQQKV